ncbi:MAG: hypothetical protein K0U93_18915, partial [Gammaproteobacteria bacterium]|nr:hypothetical protein [Gammaproteobacteria bacterium]
VQGLSAVVVVVADIDEAVARYAPYLSCEPTAVSIGVACRLGRGTLILTDPPTIERRLAIQIPSLPFIAGYALDCLSLGGTTRALLAGGCVSVDGDLPNTQCLAWPGALGGYVLVSEGAEIS